jgi:hypothetical protein
MNIGLARCARGYLGVVEKKVIRSGERGFLKEVYVGTRIPGGGSWQSVKPQWLTVDEVLEVFNEKT